MIYEQGVPRKLIQRDSTLDNCSSLNFLRTIYTLIKLHLKKITFTILYHCDFFLVFRSGVFYFYFFFICYNVYTS